MESHHLDGLEELSHADRVGVLARRLTRDPARIDRMLPTAPSRRADPTLERTGRLFGRARRHTAPRDR